MEAFMCEYILLGGHPGFVGSRVFAVNLTLDDLRVIFYMFPSCPRLLPPSLSPIAPTWNLSRPLSLTFDLGWPPSKLLHVPLVPEITSTKFEPDRTNLKFDPTFWPDLWPRMTFVLFLPCSPHVGHYFHQVWAWSEQLEIRPHWHDLWPRMT